ncbi:MAG: glutathione peroxidase, partial [Bacillota bacterium]
LDNQEKEVSLNDYKGKAFLIVNTATKCGLTPQYEGLEKLYQTFKGKGFEILDFPSNQFMNQAPGTDEEIHTFCELNYQTTFKRFHKVNVNGSKATPLFKFLKEKQPKDYKEEGKKGFFAKLFPSTAIKWNFTKFLVNKDGDIVYRFGPGFKPEDIKPFIEKVI